MASSSGPPMVDFTDFDPLKVSNTSPRPKEWKNETGSGKYMELPVMYDYGTGARKKIDRLYIQYPEMKIPRGISEKPSQGGGYNEYSVMVVFDMSNPDHVKMTNVLGRLHKQISNLIGPIKGALGLHHFNPDAPEASGLGAMIYMARDKITGELLEGRDPTQFYRTYKNTVFADLNGNSIDHNILKDAEITGYPLVCHVHVYIGTKISIKSHLESFIVTGVKKSDGLARQVSTIGRVLEQNPQAQANLEAQIAALMGDNQDVLIQEHVKVQDPQAPDITKQHVQVPVAQVPAPQVPAAVQDPAPPVAATQDLQAFLAQSAVHPAQSADQPAQSAVQPQIALE